MAADLHDSPSHFFPFKRSDKKSTNDKVVKTQCCFCPYIKITVQVMIQLQDRAFSSPPPREQVADG